MLWWNYYFHISCLFVFFYQAAFPPMLTVISNTCHQCFYQPPYPTTVCNVKFLWPFLPTTVSGYFAFYLLPFPLTIFSVYQHFYLKCSLPATIFIYHLLCSSHLLYTTIPTCILTYYHFHQQYWYLHLHYHLNLLSFPPIVLSPPHIYYHLLFTLPSPTISPLPLYHLPLLYFLPLYYTPSASCLHLHLQESLHLPPAPPFPSRFPIGFIANRQKCWPSAVFMDFKIIY